MLWFTKQRRELPASERDLIEPAELPVALDDRLFVHHLAALQVSVEASGGIEACLERLDAKQRLFAELLGKGRWAGVTLSDTERLLGTVFTARRRLYPLLAAAGEEWLRQALQALLEGPGEVRGRMERFAAELVAAARDVAEDARHAAKARRAAFDFAAETLHFLDPVRYPLMSRWVWDPATRSGALREFVRERDAAASTMLDASPETFEGARVWLKARIAEQGVFRDVHFWIDLMLAQAYVTYLRSVAEGNLGGDFGRGAQPGEQLRKLLGIDCFDGRARVKKSVSGERS